MTAERVLLSSLGVMLVAVFFWQDAVLASQVTLVSLGVAWLAALRAGLLRPGRGGVALTVAAVGWLATCAWLAPAGPHWNAVGWAAAGLTLPWLVLRAASTPRQAALLTLALLVATALVLTQAVMWAAATDERSRMVVYLPTIQWSGYPELGLLACMACGAALGLAAGGAGGLARTSAFALALLFGAATLPLGSRSAQLTVAVLPVALGVSMVARRFAPWRLAVVVATAVLIAVATLAFTPLGVTLGARLFDASAAEAISLRERSWAEALRTIAAHPWFGVGPGRFAGPVAGEHAHNFWLHTAAETGVPGALLFTLVWGRAAYLALRASTRAAHGGGLALAAHTALIAFLARSATDHFLAASTFGHWRMWMVQGCWLGLAEASQWWDVSAPSGGRPSTAALLPKAAPAGQSPSAGNSEAPA